MKQYGALLAVSTCMFLTGALAASFAGDPARVYGRDDLSEEDLKHLTLPARTRLIKPKYPRELLHLGKKERPKKSELLLLAIVDVEGSVQVDSLQSCKIIKPRKLSKERREKSCEAFYKAATEAVVQWKYVPGRFHNEPIAVYFDARVEFKLQ